MSHNQLLCESNSLYLLRISPLKTVDIFWSHQSPYCYFALDRILALDGIKGVDVQLRPVLPGVMRNPEVFFDAPLVEQRYFDIDTHRTAQYLNLPYAEALPYPIEFQPGTLFRAEEKQPRINHLYYLTAAANEMGKGWMFLDQVTRLIWDGNHRNWHQGEALKAAIERADINYEDLYQSAYENSSIYDREFKQNHDLLIETGHNGVPTFAYNSEPFFGQDRFDQLLWRMNVSLP